SVFHQMGFQSNNLIDLPTMAAYAGAIFSPINVAEADMVGQIEAVRARRKDFEIIFDPQLYVPATERGKLKDWKYFPRDLDTADLSSTTWWSGVVKKVAAASAAIKAD